MKKLFLNLVFLCFLVGYGYYSYGSFRIAKKGFELWNSGNFVTAYKAFQFVLEKNPFSIVIPFSRVFLLDVSQRKKYTEARERLIKGDFEKKLGFFESPKKWTEVFSPFAFDFMPFVLIVLNMLGILSLGAARFFNMVRTDHEGIFEAKYFFFSFVLLCWFFSDSLANLREEIFSLFSGGFSIGITMSYDYSKYFFSGYLFYLSSHKWIKSKKEISETIDFVNAPQINNRLPETVFITGPNKIFIFILFLTFCMGLSFFRTHLNVSSNRFLRPENEKTSFQPGFHGNLNGTIIGSIVNVRKAPELQGEIIFQLKEGESISFDEVRDDGWYVIPGTLGEVGYIWGSYIRPNVYQKFTNAEVTEKNGTHIKSGPGRSYETLKELKYKEKILIRNKNLNDEWLEVLLPNGKQGYVLSKRLEIK